mmetsp:Transcript_30410/g.79787  ORF Transcript_30410/g.79787 Transcript_30410/m.79787 type:complete len:304 (-) Transcript_30410:790-1701(-)
MTLSPHIIHKPSSSVRECERERRLSGGRGEASQTPDSLSLSGMACDGARTGSQRYTSGADRATRATCSSALQRLAPLVPPPAPLLLDGAVVPLRALALALAALAPAGLAPGAALALVTAALTGRGRERHLPAVALQPVVHVLALRVVVAELFPRVELVHALAGEASRGHPVSPVRAGVVVQEELLEVGRPVPPVHPEVEDEVAGNVLAAAVAHETRGLQLSHVGIHKRVSGAAVLPLFQIRTAAMPRSLVARDTPWHEDLRAIAFGHVDVEVTPSQLENKPVCGFVLCALLLVTLCFLPDAPG